MNDPSHKSYLSKMTSDFTAKMCSMIQKAITERRKSENGDTLIQEIVHHTSFCKTKLENFHGRENAQEVRHAHIYVVYSVLKKMK